MKVVLAAIDTIAAPFTAQQLWRFISSTSSDVSRATVYRGLQRLRDQGFIKDIVLSHGLHISMRTDARVYCIVECEDCGRFRTSDELSAQMKASTQELSVTPNQVALHIRGKCRARLEGKCQHSQAGSTFD